MRALCPPALPRGAPAARAPARPPLSSSNPPRLTGRPASVSGSYRTRAAAADGAAAAPTSADALRIAAGAPSADAALTALAASGAPPTTEADVAALLDAALAAGNAALALDVFRAAAAAPAAAALGLSAARWPRAGGAAAGALVTGLARLLRPDDAAAVFDVLRGTGPVPAGAGAVPFGVVVRSPLPLDLPPSSRPPLTVIPPTDGARIVACAACRYEFEVWTGTVARASSEALPPPNGVTRALAGALRRPPPPAASHELDVETPSGMSRPFRFATADPVAPARVGERVTLVCAPSGSFAPAASTVLAAPPRRRTFAPLAPSPPGTPAGTPLTVTNHGTGVVADVLPPPPPGTASTGLPRWVAPALALALIGDGAAGALDPSLPALLAAGAAAAATASLAATQIALPALKRLPESSVSLEAARSALLARHAAVTVKADAAAAAGAADAVALARLWSLVAKMGAAADGDEYAARSARVSTAAASLEARVAAAAALVDGFARVARRIEIEVELDDAATTTATASAYVAAAVDADIAAMVELELEAEEAASAAAAADEVERLLRS